MISDWAFLVADAIAAGWKFKRPAAEYFDLTRDGTAYLVVLTDDGEFDFAVRYRAGWLVDGAEFGSVAALQAAVLP